MNKSIYILVFLAISTVVLFSYCLMKRENVCHFTKQDTLYFEIYDTLKYYSLKTNKGIDTLIIKVKNIKEDYDKWHWDEVHGSDFNAFAYIEGVFRHRGAEENIHVSYSKDSLNQDPTMCIIFAERFAMEIKDRRNWNISGFYNDTIIIDDTNSSQEHWEDPHSFTFKNLKWHKYQGIVEYELSDGTTYRK